MQTFKKQTFKNISRLRRRIESAEERERNALSGKFSALGDPTRFSIFRFMIAHQGACVSDIAAVFRISVPAASQQLKLLEMRGLIVRHRMGQRICYEIRHDDPTVLSFVKIISLSL